jgi:hypothetical protein
VLTLHFVFCIFSTLLTFKNNQISSFFSRRNLPLYFGSDRIQHISFLSKNTNKYSSAQNFFSTDFIRKTIARATVGNNAQPRFLDVKLSTSLHSVFINRILTSNLSLMSLIIVLNRR